MEEQDMNQDSALTSEQAITQQVEAALQADQVTARYPIEVAYQDGAVSLFGQVDTQEVKMAAERAARGVGGVVNVTNELTIGQGGDNNGGSGLLGGLFGRGADSNQDRGGVGIPAAGIIGSQAGGAGAGMGATGAGAGVAAPLAAGGFADNADSGADVSRGTQAEAEADGQ